MNRGKFSAQKQWERVLGHFESTHCCCMLLFCARICLKYRITLTFFLLGTIQIRTVMCYLCIVCLCLRVQVHMCTWAHECRNQCLMSWRSSCLHFPDTWEYWCACMWVLNTEPNSLTLAGLASNLPTKPSPHPHHSL